jgi:acetyl esterase/lipase
MTSTPEIVIERNVAYTSGERPLLWDVYRPPHNIENTPVVLALNGGGWRGGHREMMEAACIAFARQGYVAIAPEYRLLGEVEWPVPLNDLRTAVRALRARTKSLHINPDRIFLTGYSAGAHLSLLAGGMKGSPLEATESYSEQSDAVTGIAAFFPPGRISGRFASLLGVAENALDLVSPQTYASTLPPTIIFCGDEDAVTPPQLSIDLYKAIRAAGGICDLRLFSQLIHEFVSLPGMMETTVRDAVEFFDRTAVNKSKFDQALSELHVWWNERMKQLPR